MTSVAILHKTAFD